MTVWLGNYNLPTDAGEAYDRQKSTIQEALQTYGTDNIGGITVGNEFMLKYVICSDTLVSFSHGVISAISTLLAQLRLQSTLLLETLAPSC